MFTRFNKASVTNWINFVIAMTEKEIKTRYKHTVLGFFWILLNPLLQMAVIGFIFQFFMPVKIDNYFLFLFAGLLPWNFFSYSISKSTPCIVYERSLIQKAFFPREAIVLSIILSNFFHFLISLLLFVIILFFHAIFFEFKNVFDFGFFLVRILSLVPFLLWLTLLTSSFSLFLSALNVKFRDINFVVQAVLPLWFYATPVIFTLNILPTFLRPLFYFNPMTPIIEGFHWALLNIQPENSYLWIIGFFSSVFFLILGITTFRNESKYFDDWL